MDDIPRWSRGVRRAAYWTAVGATCLLAAEATARLDDRVRQGIPLLHVPDPARDLVLRDSLGPRGRPNGRYKKWRLNRFGFRSADMTLVPAPGCTRIAVLGASETLGAYEADGQEYPSQLEDSLRGSGCVEVVNAAIAGISLRRLTHLWNTWVARFQPSVVLVYPSPTLYLSENPPADPPAPRSAMEDDPPWWTPRLLERAHEVLHYPALIQRRRVARAVARAVAGRDSSWLFRSVPADRLNQYVADLDSLVSAIRARGATPVLVTHAMRFTVPPDPSDADVLNSWRQFTPRATTDAILAFEEAAADATRMLGARRGVLVVDAASALSGHREYFGDFVHFTNRGAGVMAGLIADRLRHAVLRSSQASPAESADAVQ
ncbi:MAG TPA: hypothetical protein VM736_07580 [Gemmatimonadales bacterium]|nr:hypothetical protein [Gemmatimonadales bacterium]